MNKKIALAVAAAAALVAGSVAVAQTYGQDPAAPTPAPRQTDQPDPIQPQTGVTPAPAAPAEQPRATQPRAQTGTTPGATGQPYETTQPTTRMMADETMADGTDMQRAGERG